MQLVLYVQEVLSKFHGKLTIKDGQDFLDTIFSKVMPHLITQINGEFWIFSLCFPDSQNI